MSSILSIVPARWSWREHPAFALGVLLLCVASARAQDALRPGAVDVPSTKSRAPAKEPSLKLETPSPERIFQLKRETAFVESIRRELRPVTKTTEIPPDAKGATLPPPRTAKAMPPAREYFLPNVVCYNPLYFEQVGPERLADYIPHVQPFISACRFYTDAALLPIKMVIHPHWTRECNDDDPSRGPFPLSPVPR